MPTVIDAFVVTLGLEPSNFDEGLKKAAASKLKTSEQLEKAQIAENKREQTAMEKRLKDIELQNKKIGESFHGAAKQAIAFGVALIGAASIADFVKSTIAINANTGRLAHNLGTSTESLSMWQGAVKLMGGTADDANASITGLVTAIQQTRFGIISPQFLTLQTLLGGVTPDDANIDTLLTKLHNRLSKMDPRLASTVFGPALGLAPSLTNFLMLPDDQFQKMLAQVRAAYLVHKEDSDAAQQAQTNIALLNLAYSRLGNDVLNGVLPSLTALANEMTTFGETDKSVKDLVTDIGNLAKAFDGLGKSSGAGGFLSRAISDEFEGLAKLVESLTHTMNAISALLQGDLKTAASEGTLARNSLRAGIALTTTPGVSAAGGGAVIGGSQGNRIGSMAGGGGAPAAGVASGANTSGGQQVLQTLLGLGATQAGAIGGTAILGAESRGWDPSAASPLSSARGLGQWLKARQNLFASVLGHPLAGSSLAEQLKFVVWELQHTAYGQRALAGIRGATTVQQGEDAWARFFEGITPTTPGTRGIGADYYADMRNARKYELGGSGQVHHHTTHVHLGTGAVVVHTKATDGKGIGKDIGAAMGAALVVQAQRGPT